MPQIDKARKREILERYSAAMMMKPTFAAAALLLALGAHAAPASDASVEELLEVTQSRNMMESAYGAMEGMLRQMLAQNLGGRQLTPEQRRGMDLFLTKYTALLRDELGWDKMKPLYVEVYRDTFEQEEIDGLIAFYKSPAGQAFIRKMPVVLQKTMVLSQRQMQQLLPRMQQAVREALEEAKVPR